MNASRSLLVLSLLFLSQNLLGGEIRTNEISMAEAPKWLTAGRVERVVEKIQRFMEWDIRRIEARWFADEAAFEKAHGLGSSSVLAVSKRKENAVYLGPKVDSGNFDDVFGHELVHVILFQKYNDAIPRWLEEGLANTVAKHGSVDYRELAANPISDVRRLEHPFGQAPADKAVSPRIHYMASTALMEMISSRCDVHELLQLSLGQGLEKYLSTFCGIDDLNAEYRQWVSRKAAAKPARNLSRPSA